MPEKETAARSSLSGPSESVNVTAGRNPVTAFVYNYEGGE